METYTRRFIYQHMQSYTIVVMWAMVKKLIIAALK